MARQDLWKGEREEFLMANYHEMPRKAFVKAFNERFGENITGQQASGAFHRRGGYEALEDGKSWRVGELSRIYQVNRTCILDLIWRGKIKATQKGKLWYVPTSQLKKLDARYLHKPDPAKWMDLKEVSDYMGMNLCSVAERVRMGSMITITHKNKHYVLREQVELGAARQLEITAAYVRWDLVKNSLCMAAKLRGTLLAIFRILALCYRLKPISSGQNRRSA